MKSIKYHGTIEVPAGSVVSSARLDIGHFTHVYVFASLNGGLGSGTVKLKYSPTGNEQKGVASSSTPTATAMDWHLVTGAPLLSLEAEETSAGDPMTIEYWVWAKE